jgi:hypothetical protein
MEAEYLACSAATQDAIWLKNFLCDNTAAIAVAKDPKYHGKTKHIKMRYHYIREAITEQDVILKYISTNSMVADPLTKPIARDAFV